MINAVQNALHALWEEVGQGRKCSGNVQHWYYVPMHMAQQPALHGGLAQKNCRLNFPHPPWAKILSQNGRLQGVERDVCHKVRFVWMQWHATRYGKTPQIYSDSIRVYRCVWGSILLRRLPKTGHQSFGHSLCSSERGAKILRVGGSETELIRCKLNPLCMGGLYVGSYRIKRLFSHHAARRHTCILPYSDLQEEGKL